MYICIYILYSMNVMNIIQLGKCNPGLWKPHADELP